MTLRGKWLDIVCLRAGVTQGHEPRLLLLMAEPGATPTLPACAVGLGETPTEALQRLLARLPLPGVNGAEAAPWRRPREVTAPDGLRGVLRATKLFSTPASDADGTGYLLSRGAIVRVLQVVESFAHVASAADDLAAFWPVPAGERGFVRRSLLTVRIRLHCYDASLPAPIAPSSAPPGWRHVWLPAVPPPLLVEWQAGWLASSPE